MDLTYSLLLKLNRGAGTVVERMTAEEREMLQVETPVIRFLRGLCRSAQPKHVFLTGSAGDGKTFAIKSALDAWGHEREQFEVVLDASATYKEDRDPLEELKIRLEQGLRSGKRLLVAINRGQLERLEAYVRSASEPSELATLLEAARDQLQLKVERQGEDDSSLLVVDLGLQDVLAEDVLEAFFDRLSAAEEDCELAPVTRTAFLAARGSLASGSRARQHLVLALTRLRGTGLHVTMRQLWTLGAFLLTGWRTPGSTEALSLEDAVVARLYTSENESPLRALLERSSDPALSPEPRIARAALEGSLLAELREHEDLEPLLKGEQRLTGLSALRVAAAYGTSANVINQSAVLKFPKLVRHLKQSGTGWLQSGSSTTIDVMKGVYKLLGYPRSDSSFPTWQYLCYESSRTESATRLADRRISPSEFRLGLPRPSATAREALGDWSPPAVVLAHESGGASLRLTPELFELIYDAKDSGATPAALPGTTRLTLARWATSCRPFSEPLSGSLLLLDAGRSSSWVLKQEDLEDHLSLQPQ